MKRIIFWQDSLSIHQAPLIRNFAERHAETYLVVRKGLGEARRLLGWQSPSFGSANVMISPDLEVKNRLISSDQDETVHIFSGISAYSFVYEAFERCLPGTAKLGIMTESHDGRGIKGMLRFARSFVDARRCGRRIDFILAIGHLAMRWHEMCGYPADKLYPFAYFVESPSKLSPRMDSEVTQLCYVGQLIDRKGVDLLLASLARLRYLNWRLRIVGDGPKKAMIQSSAVAYDLAERLVFMGALANDVALSVIAGSDLLILPSRWDGWGAVVNEALMRGVAVVCTDMCGAADLIRSEERGTVVKANSIDSLVGALERWIRGGPTGAERRLIIRNWAKCIEGRTGAEYLDRVIINVSGKGGRPEAPWLG